MIKNRVVKIIIVTLIVFFIGFSLVIFNYPYYSGPSDETKTKADLQTIQVVAGMYHDKHGQYAEQETFSCKDSNSFFVTDSAPKSFLYVENRGFKAECYANKDKWSVNARQKDLSLCADSIGFFGEGAIQSNGLCK